MSYGFIDKAIHKQNYIFVNENGEIKKIFGNFWPQDLWIRHFFEKI
jgi:hypothetical protein